MNQSANQRVQKVPAGANPAAWFLQQQQQQQQSQSQQQQPQQQQQQQGMPQNTDVSQVINTIDSIYVRFDFLRIEFVLF